jgi:N-acylglucosamine-6-phosphate 2-epimerase
MSAIARAAAAGGAAGVRVDGADVATVSGAVSVPVIGLRKRATEDSTVTITPELDDALAVAAAGADVVALDATLRPRPGALATDALLRALREAVEVPILADVDSLEAGVAARAAGVDAVATTLSGYTGEAPPAGPDTELVARLCSELDCPVFAEGRYATPAEVRRAFDVGAFAVVVGTAITDPLALTRRFAAAADA